ncbi:hypothetical protein J2Z21_001542 [Streptomyces griseochromogenes]|uniref:DUF2568 domain-containing protein n=1 Tax=Streptomyces griseochromogenes TaxID=68214 RepID=A0ABS4LMY4_9ACTN|nr:YrdB family protein [Streptomyces griseochromogenes]MBP2048617.1 hypothetical protein [Streptomyces griseochromogenes]
MKTAKAVNLGVVFLLELGVLGSVCYLGFARGGTVGLLIGFLGAGALGRLWGLFGSPRARFKVRGAARFAFEALWFGAGALALYAAGAHACAAVFATVGVISKALAHAWDQ